MRGGRRTAPRPPSAGHGSRVNVPSHDAWRPILRCGALSPPSWRGSGPRSKSRAGFDAGFRAILICRCRQKRSIAVCLSKVVASSNALLSSTSAASTTFGVPGDIEQARTRALAGVHDQARFSKPYRFDSGQQRPRIEHCQVIGKAIYLKGPGEPTSRRSSSANRAT